MLLLAGHLEEGLVHLDAVIPKMPDNLYGARLRAEALEHLERTEAALTAWRDLAIHDPSAGIEVARIELERGNRRAAQTALIDALDRGGSSARELAESYPSLRPLVVELP
jgi:predicted Zn-dependent protease